MRFKAFQELLFRVGLEVVFDGFHGVCIELFGVFHSEGAMDDADGPIFAAVEVHIPEEVVYAGGGDACGLQDVADGLGVLHDVPFGFLFRLRVFARFDEGFQSGVFRRVTAVVDSGDFMRSSTVSGWKFVDGEIALFVTAGFIADDEGGGVSGGSVGFGAGCGDGNLVVVDVHGAKLAAKGF